MRAAILMLFVVACLGTAEGRAQDNAGPDRAAPPSQDQHSANGTAPEGTTDTAPSTAPRLRVDFSETEAIPGQFLTLRLTVLVPSFMPDPPVWPGFEAPNLLVRVPEGGTSPTSERIDGATWSGVTQRYLIAPMVPGRFDIPPQNVIVTWSGPNAATPERVRLSTGPLAFAGVVPDGAAGLDPFIAATDLTLTQEIAGNPGAMVPGDSIIRTVTVEVTGVSPMFLPPLLTSVAMPGVAAYPDAPRIDETHDRGTLGGTRRESVTYVVEGGGGDALAALTLAWFDIDSGEVVTATLAAVEIAVDGPPAPRADRGANRRLGIYALGGFVLVGLVGLVVLLGLALTRIVPSLRHRIATRRAARRNSEGHAWRALERVIARRDHVALRPALDTWAARVDGPDPRRDAAVRAALTGIGQARYGRPGAVTAQEEDDWPALAKALRASRRRGTIHTARHVLPPLNPGATA